VGAFSTLFLAAGAILYMHYDMIWPVALGLTAILLTMFYRWKDIIKETTD
jgi:hypothetical protein